MRFLGLALERRYPIAGFHGDLRAMTADEIVTMQLKQQLAMQNAYYTVGAMSGTVTYYSNAASTVWLNWPPTREKPLDERFADFKVRLAAAIAKRSTIT